MPDEGDAHDRWIEKSAVLFDLILQSVNNDKFQHINDLVELDDSGPKAWKLLRNVVQPNTLPMVIVLEKELAALSMQPGDDVKLEDFRKCHTGGGAANKTAQGYGAEGGSRGRGGGRGRGRGRGFGRGRGRGDYNEGHGSSGGRGSTRMEGACCALLPVIGVGNVKVMGANEGLVGLGNVLLVEGLSANLLSLCRLQKSKAKTTFSPTSCRAKFGKLLLWDLEEKSSCIKDLWQLPIIHWNGKPPATAAAAATAKANAGGEETAPTDGALDAVKKVQQPQQPHGKVLAGVDERLAWAKASPGSGDADWETWHERMCHVNFPMLQKLVKDGSLKGLEVLCDAIICIHRNYCEGLPEKYGLQDGGKPATPLPSGFTVETCADEEVVGESDKKLFHSMVGALNYAANHTQLDIAFATSRLASVVSRPSHEQLEVAKRLVHYVSATASMGLEYSAVRQRQQRGDADLGKGEMLMTCYIDAYFNSVKADGTNIGGYLCLFGGGAVS
ncbi:unnamed protein product [Closterium sp. NIES-54]